jgi:sarcosine oxidase
VAAKFDVVIVGLGAMGSAALFHLAKAGKKVLGLDRFSPPHALGSSHGQTRIIRETYFEHPTYVPIVQRAYELWDELAQMTGQQLFVQTGGLMIGRPDGVVVTGARRSAATHRLPHELLSAQEITRRFPALHPDMEMAGVWEPRAGILFPEQCIAAHLGCARDRGAMLHCDEKVLRWEADGDGAKVTTERGEYRAERLILSAGSWMKSSLPDLDLPLTVERQILFWFDSSDRKSFQPERCPIHLWEHAPGKFFYGFPDLGHGVKVAGHHEGEITDPDSIRREVAAEEVEVMRRIIRPFLPTLDGPLREAVVCMYTNTPDGHFLIDAHPSLPQVLMASPCSGHGFKFSSAIGEILAELITKGESRFDLSLFRYDPRRGADLPSASS